MFVCIISMCFSFRAGFLHRTPDASVPHRLCRWSSYLCGCNQTMLSIKVAKTVYPLVMSLWCMKNSFFVGFRSFCVVCQCKRSPFPRLCFTLLTQSIFYVSAGKNAIYHCETLLRCSWERACVCVRWSHYICAHFGAMCLWSLAKLSQLMTKMT